MTQTCEGSPSDEGDHTGNQASGQAAGVQTQIQRNRSRSRSPTSAPRPTLYGTLSSLRPPVNPTREQIVDFNAKCYVARKSGQRGVPQDLPLAPLDGFPDSGNEIIAQDGQGDQLQNTRGTAGAGHDGSGASTPRPSTPESDKRRKDREALDLVKAFDQLTPFRKRKIAMAIAQDAEASDGKDLPSLPKKLKLDSTEAVPTADVTAGSPILVNEIYADTLLGGHVVPLTTFSNRVLAEKSSRPHFVYIQVFSSRSSNAKGKVHILDSAQFDDEKTMTIPQFHEGYMNFLRYIPPIATLRFLSRLRSHYDIISSHPKFAELWPYFRDFDIWYRTHLIVTGKPHPESEYNSRLAALNAITVSQPEIQSLRDQITELKAQQGSSTSSSSTSTPPSSSHNRSSNKKKSSGSRGQGGRSKGKQPFRDSSSGHLCIMCAGPHHLDDCTAEKSAKGKSLFVKKDSSTISGLAVRSTGAAVCAAWNCTRHGTNAKCGYGHDEVHVCSLCGSPTHTALSRSCIEN
ncbi:hypothetical protein BKA70DRAFT_1235816 [Coprinopsis sp. MPI-PUGE-AT-0042]|nr:hypothetical protein BKA70DRAFT_1235816 [Coprinopsis sp. MPI-PUGE-AT-0042]